MPAPESKHSRNNSKTSLSLSRWWTNSSVPDNEGDATQGEEALVNDQDRMLAQLADELLGFDESSTQKPSTEAIQSGPTHERKLSWPFSSGRRVLPQPEAAAATRDQISPKFSVDRTSLHSSDSIDSPFSVSAKDPAGEASGSDHVPTAGEDDGHAARPQGYRRIWKTITSVRKGDRIAAPSSAAPTQEFTVESLSRAVLALKPSQHIMEAARLSAGLQALDSRAVAALLKELAKAGAPQRASELFDYLRSLPKTDHLSVLADLYTYTTVISQCAGHHQLRSVNMI